MNQATVEEIARLEAALANRDPAGIEGGLASLIAEDFLEFGASGRTWDAETTKRVLVEARGGDAPRVRLDDFEAAELGPGVVLATYRLGEPRPANRSSIWVRRAGRWQMRFHQGTLRPLDD